MSTNDSTSTKDKGTSYVVLERTTGQYENPVSKNLIRSVVWVERGEVVAVNGRAAILALMGVEWAGTARAIPLSSAQTHTREAYRGARWSDEPGQQELEIDTPAAVVPTAGTNHDEIQEIDLERVVDDPPADVPGVEIATPDMTGWDEDAIAGRAMVEAIRAEHRA